MLTGGRKGRVPSLRERFDPMTGNPALGPEISNYVELRAIHDVAKHIHAELAPFYRYTNGTIRTATGTMTGTELINTGHLDIVGVDVMARAEVTPNIGIDAAYSYINASGSTAEPLDFLPHHHYEATVRGHARQVLRLRARAHDHAVHRRWRDGARLHARRGAH